MTIIWSTTRMIFLQFGYWQQTSQALRLHIVNEKNKWHYNIDRHGPTAWQERW